MINEVSSILSDKVEIPIHNRLRKPPFIVLIEDGVLSAIKRLYIQDLPSNSYAVSLDVATAKFDDENKTAFSRLNHYLDKSNGIGINKRCDLVLFTEEDGVEIVYIFDLKSSDPDPEDVRDQLVNSELYVKYILGLAGFFYKKDVSGICFHKVIGTTRVRKKVPYANLDLRNKIAKKNKIFSNHNIKEIQILPESKKKGYLRFGELSRLF